MNCHEISKLILEGRIESQEVNEHIATCAECRQQVEFDRWLEGNLGQEMALDPQVVARVEARASQPRTRAFLSFLTAPTGTSIMKKTIWTTAGAAALTLGILTVMSPSAEASTPSAKFSAMKKALKAKQTRTMISLRVMSDANGKPKTMMLVNSQLVEMKEGVPFEYHDGNKKIIVNASGSGFDGLTPEQKEHIQKMIKDTKSDGKPRTSVNRRIIVNGKELHGKEADEFMKAHGGSVKIRTGLNGKEARVDFNFSLDEGAYSKMMFGSNENTLLLVPKSRGDVRYALALDPKTNLPSTVILQKSKAGNWTSVKKSTFEYKTKKVKI
jgi:hypothetical protein